MQYRHLGRSGLKISQICLGTMMFGGPTDEATSSRIVAKAREVAGAGRSGEGGLDDVVDHGRVDHLPAARALRLGKGEDASGGRGKSSILADAMEAVIAAVYLDGGTEQAFLLVERLFTHRMASAAQRLDRLDYKTVLQELTARQHDTAPVYVISDSGPDHDKRFFATVIVLVSVVLDLVLDTLLTFGEVLVHAKQFAGGIPRKMVSAATDGTCVTATSRSRNGNS